MSRLTWQNVINYVDGMSSFWMNKLDEFPDYKKEQVIYRLLMCQADCVPNKHCRQSCNCDLPERAFAKQSCNYDRFPDFMKKPDWECFKTENNIVINPDDPNVQQIIQFINT